MNQHPIEIPRKPSYAIATQIQAIVSAKALIK